MQHKENCCTLIFFLSSDRLNSQFKKCKYLYLEMFQIKINIYHPKETLLTCKFLY